MSPSGEASLDSTGCATESQILQSCLRNPAQKRASESWGGLRGLLSEELFQVAAVLKLEATPAKRSHRSGNSAAAPVTPVLCLPGAPASQPAHQRGCGALSRLAGSRPRAVRQYVRFNKSSYVGVSTQP